MVVIAGSVIICPDLCLFFFFFKQKTAYEMRISDWSSDVCSSDLISFSAAYIPGLIDLTIGSMDQPDTITPQFHYWHSKHLAWAEFADTLPRHPEFPPLG